MILLTGKKIGVFLIALSFFAENAVFSHSKESNFWSEQRRQVQRDDVDADQQMAGIPANFSRSADILRQFPFLDRMSQSPALSQSVTENLPQGFIQKHADFLNALPHSFGTVRRITLPHGKDTGRIVIHIQDVHKNEDAQRNIGHAVRALVEKGQVNLVALEGTFGPINLSGFRAFSRQDILKKVADFLLQVNKISGPIHSALTGPKAFPPIAGIDDPAHYDANVDAYRRSFPLVKDYKDKLAALRSDLDSRKTAAFNPDLL